MPDHVGLPTDFPGCTVGPGCVSPRHIARYVMLLCHSIIILIQMHTSLEDLCADHCLSRLPSLILGSVNIDGFHVSTLSLCFIFLLMPLRPSILFSFFVRGTDLYDTSSPWSNFGCLDPGPC